MTEERKLKLASDEQRIVWGEVYVPNVPDTDGEFMDSDSIREMAYKFMKNLKLKMIDTTHNNQVVDGATVVESFIARKGDPDFIEGAWVVGVHVPNDDVWSGIKSGKYNGFSMEALVSKTPMVIEMEIPPVISGMTQKADGGDDHVHEFFVSYDEDGNFLGGKTNLVNNHFHVIKRGTVTEDTDNHRHRFAYMDGVQWTGGPG